MKKIICATLLAFTTSLTMACTMNNSRDELPEPRSGFVTNVAGFEEFISEYRPTPEELQQVYPDLVIVQPGQMATKEFRMNNSRIFVELDDDGRVIGGRFQ